MTWDVVFLLYTLVSNFRHHGSRRMGPVGQCPEETSKDDQKSREHD